MKRQRRPRPVSDNGPGIPRKYHEKVFVIFQTLREKNDKESTGIGLAIVKKIIEDQHCTIRISSSEKNGASFIFTWPKN
jgi:K+-sensing histidine kinase KdpD